MGFGLPLQFLVGLYMDILQRALSYDHSVVISDSTLTTLWRRFGLVVASLGVSTKLLYVEPG